MVRAGLAWRSALLMAVLVSSGRAVVQRVEILEHYAFADGRSFGDTGPYEVLRGRLHYVVDPAHPRNRAVVDLQHAAAGRLREDLGRVADGRFVEEVGEDPRSDQGHVQFSGDFLLLKPVDLARGNGRLLYGVNNRGNVLMLGYYNQAARSNRPRTASHAGNGWLMRQGYTLLWSAWNWDVENLAGLPLRINLPILVEADGSPLRAKIYAELAVQSRDDVQQERIAWGGSRCYPAAAEYRRSAELRVRTGPDAKSQLIPREEWRFARKDARGRVVDSAVHVFLPGGFHKGKLYELAYVAEHPRVVGLGLAAVRDAISFFRFAGRDQSGTPNPLAERLPRHAYIFGISQSGRFITQMIYQGFHVDEADRLVFEGARPHVAGGGKGSFNYRFAQTTHHPKHLQGNRFWADHFPFHYTPDGAWQQDETQAERRQDDLFARAKALGKVPKVLICNHGGEYWTRSASLVHTNTRGDSDAKLHPSVRVYMVNGARHGTPSRGSQRASSGSAHAQNQLDASPVGRALLVALDAWVSHGTLPPASRVPRIDQGELVSAGAHAQTFPTIPSYTIEGFRYPAARHPGVNLRPMRLDYGPRFAAQGIPDYVPPRIAGPRFATLVPAADADGNPLGGIRLPRLAVPLGTYQAFNPRAESIGGPAYLKAFECSFWPFAQTRAEREKLGDTRRSIEERYASQADYVQQVERVVQALLQERLLLPEDAESARDFARALHWPPVPIDRWPFWRTVGQRD